MDQKLMDTRQRAEQLLEEAIHIWRQSNRSEQLEGLENDPVFGVLMSAVAYQSNETDDEIERMKQEVLDEYVSALLPYDIAHPVPSVACISVFPSAHTGALTLDQSRQFYLNESKTVFIPLLKTTVLPVRLAEVNRMDGRRWKVKLTFDTPVDNLSGFCFAVKNHSFRDLKVFAGNFEIPLIRPWEYSSMPFSEVFAIEHALFNGADLYDPSQSVMDMMATQDIRLYCVDTHDAKAYIPDEASQLDLVFEFTTPFSDFSFNRTQLSLNAVMLANVKICEADLDASNPIARVGGSNGNGPRGQFMYALQPDRTQVYSDEKIRVRHVSADRFNRTSVVKLLSALMDRLKSDYYAFRTFPDKELAQFVDNLGKQLARFRSIATTNLASDAQGTYIMLDNPKSESSIKVRYLVTDGAVGAEKLNIRSTFTSAAGLSMAETELIGEPVPGCDSSQIDVEPSLKIQYAVQSHGRLVTPSDIKVFCRKELLRRYGISSDLVKGLAVRHRLQTREDRGGNASGYMIVVDVKVADTGFIRRVFADRLPQAETILEKMIEVRSTAVYPVTVNIVIE